MRTALCALLVFFTGLALADEDSLWLAASSSNDTQWDIRRGSLELSKNRKGDDIAVVLGRSTTLSTRNISLRKWYVTFADCDREMGLLVVLSLEGKFVFEADFVFGGGSVASRVAELICAARGLGDSKGTRL